MKNSELFIGLGVALGFWLSDLVGNFAGGFALVLLLYLGIFGIFFAFRNAICTGFQNKFLRELDPDLEKSVEFRA